MQNRNQPSALIEKLLQPAEADVPAISDINRLCDVIRETSFEIHKFLRSGHLEKVYENALAHRLAKVGVPVIQQHPLDVSSHLIDLEVDARADGKLS